MRTLLIGSNLVNMNAFFMFDGMGDDEFQEISVESCLASPYTKHQYATKYPLIKHLDDEFVSI